MKTNTDLILTMFAETANNAKFNARVTNTVSQCDMAKTIVGGRSRIYFFKKYAANAKKVTYFTRVFCPADGNFYLRILRLGGIFIR